MAIVPENHSNVTVHIVNLNNINTTFFSTETRDVPQLTFLSTSTLPWMNEYRDQAELALLHSMLSPGHGEQPEDPKYIANDKDQLVDSLRLDVQTPVPPQEELPVTQVLSPRMPSKDIRCLNPEQRAESERASAERAKNKKEQLLKQIAKAKEERKLIDAFEASSDEKNKRKKPTNIRTRDPPTNRTSSTACYHEPPRNVNKSLGWQYTQPPPRRMARIEEWENQDFSIGRRNLELTLPNLYARPGLVPRRPPPCGHNSPEMIRAPANSPTGNRGGVRERLGHKTGPRVVTYNPKRPVKSRLGNAPTMDYTPTSSTSPPPSRSSTERHTAGTPKVRGAICLARLTSNKPACPSRS